MHLINTKSLELESFSASKIPSYAILSHTWQDEEITFEDITSGHARLQDAKRKKGWRKIAGSCHKAERHHLAYIWIDTCCINKDSSAELSEAINSMFQWYQSAEVCLAYLSDVDQSPDFRFSRWFTRGWTLQELIAPQVIYFYGRQWQYVGSKEELSHAIAQITRIDPQILANPSLVRQASVSQRMSWAATRQTERPEDIAYCLLGIFDINMPLIYGEGMKAFLRLQEEIMKEFQDYTLFTWSLPYDDKHYHWVYKAALEDKGVLALHPTCFEDSADFVPYQSPDTEIISTPRGIRLQAVLIEGLGGEPQSLALYCFSLSSPDEVICIAVDVDFTTGRCYRKASRGPFRVKFKDTCRRQASSMLLHKTGKGLGSERAFLNSVSIGRRAKDLHLLDAFIGNPVDVSRDDDDLACEVAEKYLPWDHDTQACLFPQPDSLRYAWLVIQDGNSPTKFLLLVRLSQSNPALTIKNVSIKLSWTTDLPQWIMTDLKAYKSGQPSSTELIIFQGEAHEYLRFRVALVHSTTVGRVAYVVEPERVYQGHLWNNTFELCAEEIKHHPMRNRSPQSSTSSLDQQEPLLPSLGISPPEVSLRRQPRPDVSHGQLLCTCCFDNDKDFRAVGYVDLSASESTVDKEIMQGAWDAACDRRFDFFETHPASVTTAVVQPFPHEVNAPATTLDHTVPEKKLNPRFVVKRKRVGST